MISKSRTNRDFEYAAARTRFRW